MISPKCTCGCACASVCVSNVSTFSHCTWFLIPLLLLTTPTGWLNHQTKMLRAPQCTLETITPHSTPFKRYNFDCYATLSHIHTLFTFFFTPSSWSFDRSVFFLINFFPFLYFFPSLQIHNFLYLSHTHHTPFSFPICLSFFFSGSDSAALPFFSRLCLNVMFMSNS